MQQAGSIGYHCAAMSLPLTFGFTRAVGLAPPAVLGLLLALAAQPAQTQTQTQPQGQNQGQTQNEPPADSDSDDGEEPAQRFEDWTLRCAAPPEQPTERACYLVQNVFNRDSGQRLLQLAIGHFAVERRLGALITLPLGIQLPPGITITIDGKNPLKLQAERCLPHGCQFQLLLDDALVGRFKAGNMGGIAVFNLSNREVMVPFSLKGFTAGFKARPAASP
ncbi:MAG: invasion associated locus B family protein [Kiloniellales bacterium]